eukprot:CAMPEP_0170085832 /NCGR_PEP_ID=MMETSP0019_2-20121128/20627_1 /TAXON_ID=98059 /ORGANISM="Dinobryon sp., Strain UTEXLB2267" /LENGTH=368 /DNA_ID=CAMNT_0010302511 /DNA_START=461 /DNA_END=1567 /DNA_ORIENTATION=+
MKSESQDISITLHTLLDGLRRNIWFNESSPLDAVVFSSSISSEMSEAFVSHLIVPYLPLRNERLPPLAIFYHLLQDKIDRESRRSLPQTYRKLVVTESNASPREHSNSLLQWLEAAKHTHSVDNNIFEAEALRVLHELRSQYVEISDQKSYCHDEQSIKSINFVFSTLLYTPRVTLITPSGRPHLLEEVKKSIRFSFVKEWIIVHDHKQNESIAVFKGRHPKIREIFNKDDGNFGNPERNFGMDSVPLDRTGWVYFLDDDNYVHVNMWTLMQQQPLGHIVFTGQLQGCPLDDHTAYFPQKCLVYWVDTGVGFFDRQLLLDMHWDPVRHEADGLFYQTVCNAHPDTITRTQLVASYHNGQHCAFIEREI